MFRVFLVITVCINIIACASNEAVYKKQGLLETNLGNVYVKDVQCFEDLLSFTLVNQSKCTVNRNVEIILYDGASPVATCNWYPYSTTSHIGSNTGQYGETSSYKDCECQKYRKIEFRAETYLSC